MSVRDRLPDGVKSALRRAGAPVGSVVAVHTEAPEVVLTFDDGPDPVGTPAVLDALEAHGATATFFVLLTRARRFPHLVERVRQAGHEVALHGVDHRRLTGFGHAEAYRRTAAGRAELEDLVGAGVRWFRPPHGAQSPSTWLAARRARLTPVLWGPTTWDWRDLPQDVRVGKAQEGVRAGAVVLAHDAFAGVSDGEADVPEPTVDRRDLVDRVLTAYAALGLEGRSLGAALAHGSAVREARFPV